MVRSDPLSLWERAEGLLEAQLRWVGAAVVSTNFIDPGPR